MYGFFYRLLLFQITEYLSTKKSIISIVESFYLLFVGYIEEKNLIKTKNQNCKIILYFL